LGVKQDAIAPSRRNESSSDYGSPVPAYAFFYLGHVILFRRGLGTPITDFMMRRQNCDLNRLRFRIYNQSEADTLASVSTEVMQVRSAGR
jgi:hypothetical protein